MKKRQQIAMIAAALLALFLFKKAGGTNPPPPLECPVGYASDGTKCVPQTPPLATSSGFRLSLNSSDVTSVDYKQRFRIYVPSGFTGCFILHIRLTSNNQEQVYETWSREFSNFGGGYLDSYTRIVFPTAQTTYNVFGYITDCAFTQRYTPIVYTQVRSG